MGKPAYVYSTLTCDQAYTEWKQGPNDHPMQGRTVVIKGGAGVANDRVITPLGVRTEIEEEDIPVLKANEVFKLHEANGFVRIDRNRTDAEKVASDMQRGDGSAPLTTSTYEGAGEGIAKPKG